MLKKPSELSQKEKSIINNGIFVVIVIAVLILSFKAYFMYQEDGFQTCLLETDVSGVETKLCFNTSNEANEYLKARIRANNLDYKYINKYSNISFVE